MGRVFPTKHITRRKKLYKSHIFFCFSNEKYKTKDRSSTFFHSSIKTKSMCNSKSTPVSIAPVNGGSTKVGSTAAMPTINTSTTINGLLLKSIHGKSMHKAKRSSLNKKKKKKSSSEKDHSILEDVFSTCSSSIQITPKKNNNEWIHEVLNIVNGTGEDAAGKTTATTTSNNTMISQNHLEQQQTQQEILNDSNNNSFTFNGKSIIKEDDADATPGITRNAVATMTTIAIQRSHENRLFSSSSSSPSESQPSKASTSSREYRQPNSTRPERRSSKSKTSRTTQQEQQPPLQIPLLVSMSSMKQPKKSSLSTSRSNHSKKNKQPNQSKLEHSRLKIWLPEETRPIIRHRSIKFKEKTRVKRIPMHSSPVNTNELWFQPEEYDEIKGKRTALIKDVQNNKTDGATYCTRGLERQLKVHEFRDNWCNAWDSVLKEQEFQRDHCFFDNDRLSQAYSKCTRGSSLEALERAKQDESAIKRYMAKTRQVCRSHGVLKEIKPSMGN